MESKTKPITSQSGFIYEVEIKHRPEMGFSMAYYKGNIISEVDLNKLNEPMDDDDFQWEIYEEKLDEWTTEAEILLVQGCIDYFNEEEKKHDI